MKPTKTNVKVMAYTILALLLTTTSMFATEKKDGLTKEDRVKGLVIFSMTKYVLWPQADDELVIGILSDDQSMVDLFTEIASQRSSTSKKITIKSFSSAAAAAKQSDILFIPYENSAAFENISNMDIQNVLIITEKEGLGKQGSAINLVTVDGKLRFEINKKAVEKAGLKVSSKLTEMGIEV